MNLHLKSSLAALTLCVSVSATAPCLAQMSSSSGDAAQAAMTSGPVPGQREAVRMVPAQAALKEPLDARKVQPGYVFHATLVTKAKLTNGIELPVGTVLTGEVAEDDQSFDGTLKLALRFTSAMTKAGVMVPIRATIVDAQKPEAETTSSVPLTPGHQQPNPWTNETLEVNQMGVMSNVDMHSAIASRNSGVFVGHNNKDVKLAAGSELGIAIAARPAPAQ